jgi:uncharacterized protein YjbI with pentapeptide repeats
MIFSKLTQITHNGMNFPVTVTSVEDTGHCHEGFVKVNGHEYSIIYFKSQYKFYDSVRTVNESPSTYREALSHECKNIALIERAQPGACLHLENLENMNMSNWDLSGIDFERSNLRGADLSGANLTGANLSLVDLTGANLKGANLTGATLQSACLSMTDLTGANLFKANLTTKRQEYHKDGVYGWHKITDLSHSNLKDANLSGANLCGVDLHDATLDNVKLITETENGIVKVNLEEANLTNADLSNLHALELLTCKMHLKFSPSVPVWQLGE